METKGVRSLDMLHKFGSTGRVLNLYRVFEKHSGDPEYEEKPLFKNPKLNRAIIVKHRLRSDEQYLMPRRQKVVTKIIFPLIRESLNFGGQAIFVNQTNYREALAAATGSNIEALKEDMELLVMINKLPSLDPFLLREYLRKHDHFPADCYFDIAPADVERMRNFTSTEISRLIEIAFSGGDATGSNELVTKMVDLILSNEADEKLEPLRVALGLEGDSFRDGIFAWRGFIYFKWQMDTIYKDLVSVIGHVDKVRITDRADSETKANISRLAAQLKQSLREVAAECKEIMSLYDKAFDDLIEKAHAAAFKKFLLESPQLFIELGHLMGVVSHIGSFWSYRFPNREAMQIDAKGFEDILMDFVHGLSYTPGTRTYASLSLPGQPTTQTAA